MRRIFSLFLALLFLIPLIPSFMADGADSKEYSIISQPTSENPTVITSADASCNAKITYVWYEVRKGENVYEMTRTNSATTIKGGMVDAEYKQGSWAYTPETFWRDRTFTNTFYVPTQIGDIISVVADGPTPVKYFFSNGGKEIAARDGSMLAAVQYDDINYLFHICYGTEEDGYMFPTADDHLKVQIFRNKTLAVLPGENERTLSRVEFEKEYFVDVMIEDKNGIHMLRSDRFMREHNYEIVLQPTAGNPTVATNADGDIKSVQWMMFAKAGEKSTRTLEVTQEGGYDSVKGHGAYMYYDGEVWRYSEALVATGSSEYNIFDIAVKRGDVLRFFPQGNTPIYKITIPYVNDNGILCGSGGNGELTAKKLWDGSYEIAFENSSEESDVSDLEVFVYYGVDENNPASPTASDTIRATVTRRFSATSGVELITPESDILCHPETDSRFYDQYVPDEIYLSDGWWEDAPNGLHQSTPVSLCLKSGDMVAVELENPKNLMQYVNLRSLKRDAPGDSFIYFHDTRVFIGGTNGYSDSEVLCTTANRARVTVFNEPRSYPVLLEGENGRTLSKVEPGRVYYCVVEFKNGKKLTSDTFGGILPKERAEVLMKKVPRWVAIFALRYNQRPAEWEGGDYFDDVSEEDDVYISVCWAYENNIINGTGNRLFSPDEYLTREQLAVILYRNELRCDRHMSEGADLSVYADADKISPWAYDAVAWAVAARKIIPHSETELWPQEEVMRTEFVKSLFKMG